LLSRLSPRWSTTTTAVLVSLGTASKNSRSASTPPADAPMPTIGFGGSWGRGTPLEEGDVGTDSGEEPSDLLGIKKRWNCGQVTVSGIPAPSALSLTCRTAVSEEVDAQIDPPSIGSPSSAKGPVLDDATRATDAHICGSRDGRTSVPLCRTQSGPAYKKVPASHQKTGTG
jgi:hypothetical protein